MARDKINKIQKELNLGATGRCKYGAKKWKINSILISKN
jgi:hypothetical protein